MSSIALVDCNNFFVSCERVFNPKLQKRPVVVLSSNDGCIIARSSEAKALGIPMGVPYFQWADFIRAHDVVCCSSNFALYGDFSYRVMRILEHFNPDLEIYSVDEAFLWVGDLKNPVAHCRHIRQKVLQWTGIPVSIGIANTKTLAKITNMQAKKNAQFQGVYYPNQKELNAILESLSVSEIWGIGKKLTQFLARCGIHTAAKLRDSDDTWVRKNLSVTGLRTVWELRGISSIPFGDEVGSKQSIMTSRSFSHPIREKEELKKIIAFFVARGGEKLRDERSRASWLQVFITGKEYGNQALIIFPEPTNFTPTLIEYAHRGLDTIFRAHAYKRGGVLLGGLVSENCYQRDLFVNTDAKKQKKVMNLLDDVNYKFRDSILRFAAEGKMQTKKNLCSACFTTSWDELLTIQI